MTELEKERMRSQILGEMLYAANQQIVRQENMIAMQAEYIAKLQSIPEVPDQTQLSRDVN